MSDGSPHDPAYLAAMSVAVIFAAAILIALIPFLFQLIWQTVPPILLLMIIFGAVRGMLRKLFD